MHEKPQEFQDGKCRDVVFRVMGLGWIFYFFREMGNWLRNCDFFLKKKKKILDRIRLF